MKSYLTFLKRFALALLVAGVVSACDSSTSALQDDAAEATDSFAALSAELAADLSLSSDQQQAMDEAISRFGSGDVREPGFLWRLAARLSDELTDEQKEALFAKAAERSGGARPADGQSTHGERPGMGGSGMGGSGMGGQGMGGPGAGDRPGMDGAARGGGPLGDILTEDQKTELGAIREAHSEEIRGLVDALHNAAEGDREAAREALQAAHDAVKAEIDAWLDLNLTQEQKDALDAIKADREAERELARAEERAVMQEVLGINDAAADEIHAIIEQFGDEVAELRESFGTDREGFGAAVAAAAQARDTGVNEVLAASGVGQDKAFEIYRIHNALRQRAQKHRPGGGPGGPGGRGPGGQTGG